MATYGAVVVSRNDNYGGDLIEKFKYTLTSLINNLDEVYYVDWNSPDDKPLIDEIKQSIPHLGKLHSIVISQQRAKELTNYSIDVQNCVEVLARNIGVRRLSTDFIASTNSDILIPSKDNVAEYINATGVFYTVARTEIDFSMVKSYEPNSQELYNYLMSKDIGSQHASGSPLGENDKWSLITCPGDFQVAHRSVWHIIKGFDEDMIMRGYADSNVQRKADYYGFKQELVRGLKAFHFAHYPDNGSSGGNTMGWNDPEKSLFNYQGTENSDNWGFSNIDFEEKVI
jgi:hypothetical protein